MDRQRNQRNDRLGRGRLWWPFRQRRKVLRRYTESNTHANTFSDPNRDSYSDSYGDCNCNAYGYSHGYCELNAQVSTYAAAAPDSGTSAIEVRK